MASLVLHRCLTFFLALLVLAEAAPYAAAQSCSSAATFPKNRLYAACNDLPHLSSTLRWTYDTANSTLSIAFAAAAPAAGWASWAINPARGGGMVGAQALIAFRQPSGAFAAKTFNVSAYGPIAPGPIAYKVADLEADHTAGGMMRIFASVKLPPGTTEVSQVWQVGNSVSGGVPDAHAFRPDNLAAKGTIDLVRGQSTSVADPRLAKKNIHGVLNAVSWGILLPMGAIMARYLKTFKSASPAWFYLHVSCQLSGYAVGVAGWATGLNLGSKSKGVQYTTHRNIGITLFSLGTLQIFALFLRPKKDHKYRFYWSIYHHLVGYTVIVLGVINVFKGLNILSPAQKWRTAYIIAICILGGVALLLEVITWVIVLRRKQENPGKLYDGSHATNGGGVQQPLEP